MLKSRRTPRHRADIVPFYDQDSGGAIDASPLQRKAALRVLDLTEQMGGVGRLDASSRNHDAFLSNKWATPWKSFEPEMGHLHNAVALAKSAQARRAHAQAAKKRKEP